MLSWISSYNSTSIKITNKRFSQPGIEPGSAAWQSGTITTIPRRICLQNFENDLNLISYDTFESGVPGSNPGQEKFRKLRFRWTKLRPLYQCKKSSEKMFQIREFLISGLKSQKCSLHSCQKHFSLVELVFHSFHSWNTTCPTREKCFWHSWREKWDLGPENKISLHWKIFTLLFLHWYRGNNYLWWIRFWYLIKEDPYSFWLNLSNFWIFMLFDIKKSYLAAVEMQPNDKNDKGYWKNPKSSQIYPKSQIVFHLWLLRSSDSTIANFVPKSSLRLIGWVDS